MLFPSLCLWLTFFSLSVSVSLSLCLISLYLCLCACLCLSVCLSLSHTNTDTHKRGQCCRPCSAIPIGSGLEQGKSVVSVCEQMRGAVVSVSVPKKVWLLTGSQAPLGQGLGHVTVWLWQLSLLCSHTTLWRLMGIPSSLFLFLLWKILPCLCSLPVFLFLGWVRS